MHYPTNVPPCRLQHLRQHQSRNRRDQRDHRQPERQIIAPWREWDLLSREKLMRYADQHGIPVDGAKRKGPAPYSMDANLLHISYEGGILEDPNYAPDDSMWRLTVSPEKAPNKPQVIELTYKHGDVVSMSSTVQECIFSTI